jgi:hypothetical protein
MGIVHNPATELAKELRKWEQHHTQYAVTEDGTSAPGNPYTYRAYPKMLYKAQVWGDSGKALVSAPALPAYGWRDQNELSQAELKARAFTTSCRFTVQSEDEHTRARDNGWRDSPQEALEFYDSLQKQIADAAAEANFAASRMSEKAQRDRKGREDATHRHVPE